MPRVQDLVELKFLAVVARHLGFVTDGNEGIFSSLTALGNFSQANAYQIIGNVNQFTTVTASNNSAKLPIARTSANGQIIIRNSSPTNILHLFPGIAGILNNQVANTSMELLPGQTATCFKMNDTQWVVSLDGGGGGSVVVGGTISTFATSAPPGWLLLQGGTIGSASSGATLYGSANALNLYTYFWNNLVDAQAPVSTGRGASASADFAANKTLTVPDARQRFLLNKAASGTGSTLGGTGGSIDHAHNTKAHYHGMGTGADLTLNPTAGNFGTSNWVAQTGSGASYAALNHQYPTLTNFTGRIGKVTGGVDGNTDQATTTNNPPFLTINTIIKY